MSAPLTQGQRLAADAAAAAEVRGYQTDPDVVALRVERVRTQVERLMWAGMVLGLLFTMVNVQQFAATGTAPYSLGWWAAWLLDPMVSLVLLGVLRAEQITARYQVEMGPWPRVAKWTLLAGTYVMNTWSSWVAGSPAQVVLHSVPVLTVLVAAEAVTDCQDKLTECVHRAHAYATDRARHRGTDQRVTGPGGGPTPVGAVEQIRSGLPGTAPGPTPVPTLTSATPPEPSPAPIPPPVPEPLRSVPVRPDSHRTGSTRTGSGGVDRPVDRSATVRTDAELAGELRQLAQQRGGTPSQYAIKQALGVGSGRAARLLAGLTTTPTGAATNGAARTEGTR